MWEKEEEKRYYEYSDRPDRCKYDLDCVKSCRECVFNVLCNLEKWKGDTHHQEKTS